VAHTLNIGRGTQIAAVLLAPVGYAQRHRWSWEGLTVPSSQSVCVICGAPCGDQNQQVCMCLVNYLYGSSVDSVKHLG
jgi:hypothetical protein